MPDAKWLNEANVKAALQDTSLEIETVDRALVRRYTQMFRFGQFERPYDPGEIDAQAHGAVSRTIGSQIAVLLKNDGGLLPLDADAGSIVIIGQSDVRRRRLPGRRRLVEGDPAVHRAAAGRHAGRAARPRLVRDGDQGDRRRRPVQPGRGQAGGRGGRRGRAHGGPGGDRGRRPAGRQHAQRPEPDAGRAAGHQPDHGRGAEGQQPGADAVDRQGPGGAGGVEPGRRGRTRRRRPAVRRREPLRQGADVLPQVGGRHAVRRAGPSGIRAPTRATATR